MNLSKLENLNENELTVIRALSCNRWMSFREIKERCGFDDSKLHMILTRLVKHGLVKAMKIGSTYVYRLEVCVNGQECCEDDCGDPCSRFFTRLVNHLIRYIEYLADTTKGTTITVHPGKFVKWLETQDPKFVKCLNVGRPRALVIHIFEEIRRRCEDCFFDVGKRGTTKVAIIRKDMVNKVVEILGSLLS